MTRWGSWGALVMCCVLPSLAVAAEEPPPAAPSPGAVACGAFVNEVQTNCKAILGKQAQLDQLLTLKDEAALSKAKEVADLKADLAKAKAEPFADSCEAFDGVKSAPNCDRLASLVTGYVNDPAPHNAAETRKQAEATIAVAKQSDRRTSTNKSGSQAQLDPVESIQPITLGGGAVTLSGTRAGTKGVGTITVNPIALTRPENAALGRVFDLSVSAPFDLDGGTSQDRRYVSARLRVNATAPISAARLNRALAAFFRAEGKWADSLQGVLEHAGDLKGCVNSILKTNKVTRESCGETLDDEFVRKLQKDAYEEIASARREADAYYFGLDARFDSGDPTGTEIVGDKGTHLLGGLAGGVRIPLGSSTWDWELRGRFAGDYFKSRDAAAGPAPDPVYSVDWGAAMILSGRVEAESKQRMAFGIGVEGRHAGDKPEAKLAPTNYANLNLMAIVPAADGGDIGLAFSIPIADSEVPRGAIVSLSTDLGILDRSTH